MAETSCWCEQVPPRLRDKMESFWPAETLKYLYLLLDESSPEVTLYLTVRSEKAISVWGVIVIAACAHGHNEGVYRILQLFYGCCGGRVLDVISTFFSGARYCRWTSLCSTRRRTRCPLLDRPPTPQPPSSMCTGHATMARAAQQQRPAASQMTPWSKELR